MTVQCNTTSCFFTDPTPYTSVYRANVTTNGKVVANYEWTHSPINAATFSPVNGNNTYSISWLNTPNSPTRTIKVKVNFTDGSFVESSTQNVIVKHIAPITSMTITGGSPSTINTSAASVSIPCGIATRTVSVPTPFTDPNQAVTYTWSLPPGWTGSSTTNTINVTTTTGSGGVISVRARRTDGNGFVERIFIMNITRPVVSIPVVSGNTALSICVGSTRSFSATAANATTFSWSGTGPIALTPSQASVNVLATGNGKPTLTATANNACLIPQSTTVFLSSGIPTINSSNDVLVDGHPNYYPNYTTGSSFISIQNQGVCTAYIWELFGGSGYYYASYGCSACNNPSYNQCNSANASTSSSMALRVRSANNCGIGNDVIIPLQVSSGSGYYQMVSANPAKNIIAVELKGDQPYNKLKTMDLVSDSRSNIVRHYAINNLQRSEALVEDKRISFEVSDLPRGIYHLIMVFGENKSFNETIILE